MRLRVVSLTQLQSLNVVTTVIGCHMGKGLSLGDAAIISLGALSFDGQ